MFAFSSPEDPDVDLTRDLDLDSLARVELLIALRTQLPNPPAITVSDMCEFRTLGDLQAALEGRPWPGLPRDTEHLHVEATRPELPDSPLAWMIEQFLIASGASALREVSLLRDPGTANGPITVRGQGKRLALVSDVTHGTARIAGTGPRPITVRDTRRLDECLDRAKKWAADEFQGTARATSVREVHVRPTGILATPGQVSVAAGRAKDGRAECDVVLRDATGADEAAQIELRGVRLIRHPR
ncbi:acyl carrier protein [Lentzea sp. NPDC054927]